MILTLIELMGLVIFASILQKNYKIPSPITIMSVILIAMTFNFKILTLNSHQFDNIVLITLPLLIASDALKLHWYDIKTHWFSLFWVAVVAVLLSIGFGVLFNDFFLIDYHLSIAAVVILFCMISATNPITVSSVFSNFKVPHKLKVLTEGESLFNDATALIVFAIALIALQKPEDVTTNLIVYKTISVIFGAIGIGVVLGLISIVLLKLSDEALVESTIIIFTAYSSYLVAEKFHFSGILSVIITMLITNKKIQDIIKQDNVSIDNAEKKSNFTLLRHAITTKDNHEIMLKSMEFSSMFASAILFISIASIVDFNSLLKYKYEILSVFFASTIIRAIMMLKFAVISNKIKYMQSINKNWWMVLTFAGSKGALSILMVHMIPNNFEYKILFENIIVGNILLSTFSYAFILAIVFHKNKAIFEQEIKLEEHVK